MAISSTAVWECRTTGSQTNGGFYKSDAGTTDYSQQDSAQLSLSDIATDGAGTGVSSATGGFTAAMVGNGIYITGGGTTSGWYEITAYTDTNNITIDRSAGVSKSGATGNVGGAIKLLHDNEWSAPTAGNIIWIKSGEYTLTSNVTSSLGSEALPIFVRGYNSSRGDKPTGTNRPLFTCGSYYLDFANYVNICHLRATGAGTIVMRAAYAGMFKNCKSQNTSATAGRNALGSNGAGTIFIDSEAISDAGEGIYLAANGCKVLFCYIHDCAQEGIECASTGGYSTIAFNIIETCGTTGINGTTATVSCVMNNVIYNCTTAGFKFTTGDNHYIINNIFHTCGVGISFTDGHEGENYENYNNLYNCTTDRENIDVGEDSIDTDPGFTNAAGGDFSLTGASTMIDAGMALRLAVGA